MICIDKLISTLQSVSHLSSGTIRALAGSVHAACDLRYSTMLLQNLRLAFPGKNLLQLQAHILTMA